MDSLFHFTFHFTFSLHFFTSLFTSQLTFVESYLVPRYRRLTFVRSYLVPRYRAGIAQHSIPISIIKEIPFQIFPSASFFQRNPLKNFFHIIFFQGNPFTFFPKSHFREYFSKTLSKRVFLKILKNFSNFSKI